MFGRGNPLAISPGRRCAEGREGSEIRTSEAWKSECDIYRVSPKSSIAIIYFLHVLSISCMYCLAMFKIMIPRGN